MQMKKFSSILVAAVLSVAMVVPAFAASSTSSSSAATTVTTPAAPAATTTTVTTTTGQVINNNLVAAYAASVAVEGGNVSAVSTQTIVALTNYIKSAIGANAAILASFKDDAKPGKTSIKCANIVAGLNYVILVQLADGTVIAVAPTKVSNGSITYNRPAGAVASISIVQK